MSAERCLERCHRGCGGEVWLYKGGRHGGWGVGLSGTAQVYVHVHLTC